MVSNIATANDFECFWRSFKLYESFLNPIPQNIAHIGYNTLIDKEKSYVAYNLLKLS